MTKIVRTFALTIAGLTTVSAAHASIAGSNPRPQPGQLAPFTSESISLLNK